MDLVDYDKKTFNYISKDFLSITKNLSIKEIDFVPISALKGDMVVERGENMKWYSGPTLIEILESVKDGNSIALISDAGTPLIPDPGQELIKVLIENNIQIISIPGPSSILVALTLSGFDTDKFEFHGFIPKSGKNREIFFTSLKGLKNTLICFTSPKRVIKDLNEFINYEIENEIVICREMTKKFETIYRGSAKSLLDELHELIMV